MLLLYYIAMDPSEVSTPETFRVQGFENLYAKIEEVLPNPDKARAMCSMLSELCNFDLYGVIPAEAVSADLEPLRNYAIEVIVSNSGDRKQLSVFLGHATGMVQQSIEDHQEESVRLPEKVSISIDSFRKICEDYGFAPRLVSTCETIIRRDCMGEDGLIDPGKFQQLVNRPVQSVRGAGKKVYPLLKSVFEAIPKE